MGPFIGFLVGIPLAIFVIRRWSSAGKKEAEDGRAVSASKTLDKQTREQIEKELSNLDNED